MKRNKDYLYFILSEVQDSYDQNLNFVDVMQKWIEMEQPTENECKDFIHAEQLLRDEGFIHASFLSVRGEKLITLHHLTWKGHDLIEQLKG
jgi:hypothetical protein